MPLVAKLATAKDFVELEGVEGCSIFTCGRCVAGANVRKIFWVRMEFPNHSFGHQCGSVGEKVFVRDSLSG